MEEKIKEIISGYIKTDISKIDYSTLIDRNAVSNSILLHRMYARLADGGVMVENYADIRTFGDLVKRVQRTNGTEHSISIQPTASKPMYIEDSAGELAIGIDVEEVEALPKANDFREENFYQLNFSSSEIAYCILQVNPYASFAGLFAAKEAIIKADSAYKDKPLHSIIIDHTPDGRPVHNGFYLSISHTEKLAVAVAARSQTTSGSHTETSVSQSSTRPRESVTIWLAALALILAAVAFIKTL